MKLHHIGKVVRDLDNELAYYKEAFGFKATAEPVIDPVQKVEVVFVQTGFGESVTIELIRPISEDSPVFRFLEKGGGLHHLCFEVENINKAIDDLKSKGALIISKPVPGKGHADKMTVWLYTAQKELIELVENRAKG